MAASWPIVVFEASSIVWTSSRSVFRALESVELELDELSVESLVELEVAAVDVPAEVVDDVELLVESPVALLEECSA